MFLYFLKIDVGFRFWKNVLRIVINLKVFMEFVKFVNGLVECDFFNFFFFVG